MRGSWLVLLLAVGSIGAGWFVFADPPPETPEQVQKFLEKLKEAEKDAKKDMPVLPLAIPGESKTPTPLEGVEVKTTVEEPGKSEEELLKKAGLKTDSATLLEFFRIRTLPDGEREQVARLIRQLGSDIYRQREEASNTLIKGGPKVQELLRSFLHESDREVVRRTEKCLQAIQDADVVAEAYGAAVRLLALRKPAGAAEVMLAYLPFTDNDVLVDEISSLLSGVAVQRGKADPVLLAGLADRQPIRRAIAAEAMCRVAYAGHQTALHKLLDDPAALVRFRTAQALAYVRQREAVSALIQTLPELPLKDAWQAEDFLFRLAETSGRMPPSAAMGNEAATRQKCRDAWLAWWKAEGEQVDLAKLQAKPQLLNRTLLVLLDQGQVLELGPDNQPRWQIGGLVFPLDVQLLDEKSILVAEYHANRVTERDLRGNIRWQQEVIGPLLAQRLLNGNTFVATDSQFLEFDKDGNEKLNLAMPEDTRKIMKAMKLPNGEIACLTSDGRVTRFDASGKELKELYSFPVQLGTRLFGGRIHMLSNGRVLVPHNAEDKVIEYDGRGKAVWEVHADKPVAAVRLPNGHTLITSMNPASGAIEVDRAGQTVWSYRTATRVTRALKR